MRLLLESTVTSFDAADPDLFLSAATTETYFWARATEVVSGCIQLYGAIGFTWEFGHHFYLRRVSRRTWRCRATQNVHTADWPGRRSGDRLIDRR